MPKKRFIVTGVVRRTVVDTITVVVTATTLERAKAATQAALELYPKAHSNPAVSYCYIEDREQESTEVLSLEGEEKK